LMYEETYQPVILSRYNSNNVNNNLRNISNLFLPFMNRGTQNEYDNH
jgi:hypothetical protein